MWGIWFGVVDLFAVLKFAWWVDREAMDASRLERIAVFGPSLALRAFATRNGPLDRFVRLRRNVAHPLPQGLLWKLPTGRSGTDSAGLAPM